MWILLCDALVNLKNTYKVWCVGKVIVAREKDSSHLTTFDMPSEGAARRAMAWIAVGIEGRARLLDIDHREREYAREEQYEREREAKHDE